MKGYFEVYKENKADESAWNDSLAWYDAWINSLIKNKEGISTTKIIKSCNGPVQFFCITDVTVTKLHYAIYYT